jgi:hypothetical protein
MFNLSIINKNIRRTGKNIAPRAGRAIFALGGVFAICAGKATGRPQRIRVAGEKYRPRTILGVSIPGFSSRRRRSFPLSACLASLPRLSVFRARFKNDNIMRNYLTILWRLP